jgi:GTP cyclohydrolase I
MEELFKKILEEIGEDPNREGLQKTPARAAKAFKYITKGYSANIEDIINDALFESEAEEMVIVKDIELYSLCEHHLLPFYGKCHVGYIPKGKILGLSKIARIVDAFSRRLQVQERLTKQIGDTIQKYTGCYGVGVVIDAHHLCMMMRGVEKQNSHMKTSYMIGQFRSDHRTRDEFLNLIR